MQLETCKFLVATKIKYFANDSIIYDLEHNVIKLYNKAKVIYNKINLEAYFITINFKENTLFAQGKIDTNDILIQNPIFQKT